MIEFAKVVLFWPVALSAGFVVVSLLVAVSGWLERRARRQPPLVWGRNSLKGDGR